MGDVNDASASAAGQDQHGGPTLVSVPEGVLLQHVADETVLLQLDSGTYFTLDAIGTRMLDLSCQLPDVRSVVAVLVGEYETTAEEVSSDLEKLLDALETQSLVVRRQ